MYTYFSIHIPYPPVDSQVCYSETVALMTLCLPLWESLAVRDETLSCCVETPKKVHRLVTEGLGSVPSTDTVAHNSLRLQFQQI